MTSGDPLPLWKATSVEEEKDKKKKKKPGPLKFSIVLPGRTVACLAARETRASMAVSCAPSRVRTSRSNTSGNTWPCTKPSMAPDRVRRERECDASAEVALGVSLAFGGQTQFRGETTR